MNINKTSAVITAGGLILTALPVVGVSAASAAPVSASQVTQTQLQPRAAKSSVTVSSKRVSGNRVRVVAKTKAKKISVKYRAGKMLKTSKRVSRGKAAVILPSRTTRISVRVVGSPWRAVSVPRFTGGATGGGNNAGGAGGAGSGNRGNAQDPAFAEDTWTDHLPPVFGGPPGIHEDFTYSPISATEFANATWIEINQIRASGVTCAGVWHPPVPPLTRHTGLDAAGFTSAPYGYGDPVHPNVRAGMPADGLTFGIVRPGVNGLGLRSTISANRNDWQCEALMRPNATIAGVGAENPDPNPGNKISRFVSIFVA